MNQDSLKRRRDENFHDYARMPLQSKSILIFFVLCVEGKYKKQKEYEVEDDKWLSKLDLKQTD